VRVRSRGSPNACYKNHLQRIGAFALYLVIGATGRVGREVVAQLRASGSAVRALSREPDELAADGVQAVWGDLADPASLASAAAGIAAAFLIWPALYVAAAPPAVAAIAGSAAKVVYLSTAAIRDDLEIQDHPLSAMHARVEQVVREHASDWTILRATKFAANTLGWRQNIMVTGVVEGAHGNMRRSPIDERDIAAAAVAVLHAGVATRQTIVISGPESLTERAQLAQIGTAIQRSQAAADRGWSE
jgi:uncharacterized protein YbjT (DUF2867 family)